MYPQWLGDNLIIGIYSDNELKMMMRMFNIESRIEFQSDNNYE